MIVEDTNGARTPLVEIEVTFVSTNDHAPNITVSSEKAHVYASCFATVVMFRFGYILYGRQSYSC